MAPVDSILRHECLQNTRGIRSRHFAGGGIPRLLHLLDYRFNNQALWLPFPAAHADSLPGLSFSSPCSGSVAAAGYAAGDKIFATSR